MFLHWRQENTDLLGVFQTYEQLYKQKANIVNLKQKQYEDFVDESEQARVQAAEDLDNIETVAPNTEMFMVEEISPEPSEEFIHYDPDTFQHRDFDIGPELDMSSKYLK